MQEKLKQYIVETFMYGEGDIEPDQSLFGGDIIDSLGFMKLIAFIEKEFDVELDMSEVSMENFDSLNEMMKTISKKTEA
ncbi:MAG: acyl carrier protein [Acidobacteriota bacterium]|nr:acyl carrier protein [Acidobacteriota bacterium]